MTAANDDVDEEALLYGDVGACATTTATNGENSTRALNFEPARWIALRRARRDDARRRATTRTDAWVTDGARAGGARADAGAGQGERARAHGVAERAR